MKMKSKLMLLATAAMLVATNAQAGFLTPESKRCTSNHFYGIYKPNSTRLGNCDVAANRVADPVVQAKRPYQPITAPGMLMDVPHDTVTPLVDKEVEAAKNQIADAAKNKILVVLPAITQDPRLLQYLPKGYFEPGYINEARVLAAFNRLVRGDAYYVNPPLPGLRTLADRLRCLVSKNTKTFDNIEVCEIEEDAGV
jgi:hypothetical protein